ILPAEGRRTYIEQERKEIKPRVRPTAMVRPMRLEAGRRFAPATVQVASETQARCLRAVGLDPAIYGEAVAPALLGNEAYRALRAAGLSIDGWVETDTRFEQREPAKLGEALTLAFHVAAGEAHPRGWRVRLVFDFARGGVETPLLRFTMGAIQGEPREAPAQASRPAEDPREGFAQAAALQLTPQ